MNFLDTTTLRSCPDCTNANELICLIDKYLSVSATAVLNNSRYGLSVPANRHPDQLLLHYRYILNAKSFNEQYAHQVTTAQIGGLIKQIIYRNGL